MYVSAYKYICQHLPSYPSPQAHLNNDSMSWKVDAPSQSGCADQNFDVTIQEVFLYQVSILSQHSSMVNSKSVCKHLSKLFVAAL